MKTKAYQILNITSLVGVIAVNYLANALPIAGKTTGELSDLYPSVFTPAGFTFSIWGIIYILLIIFAVYQTKGLFGNSDIPRNEFLQKIGPWFMLSSIGNMAWIFAWHFEVIWLSVLLMLVILFPLIKVYLRLGIGYRIVSKNQQYFVHMPFSVYLGWITVATIANGATLLVDLNWNGFDLAVDFWASAMIATATVITLIVLFTRRDLFYSLVIIWAFVGIIAKRVSIGEPFFLSIIIFASAGIFLIVSTVIYQAIKGYLRR